VQIDLSGKFLDWEKEAWPLYQAMASAVPKVAANGWGL
jgi:hypothetical protein